MPARNCSTCSFSDADISRLFARIEPHDALHYSGCVAYNHRRGRLLQRFDYSPSYRIVGVDAGGQVCTETYNGTLDFNPEIMAAYDALYQDVVNGFAARNEAAIAGCAERSTRLHAARTGNDFLHRLLASVADLDALGVLTTHSGTCGGVLLPGDSSDRALAGIEAAVGHLGTVFRTRTLAMPGLGKPTPRLALLDPLRPTLGGG